MPHSRNASPLAGYLAISYALLITYACLHPLTGWTISGLPLFDYLSTPWPKYYRGEDVIVNVLGYVPLGFVLAPALMNRMRPAGAILLATALGGTLSLGIETTQNFLPSRISSNVDLGSNLLGTLLGAALGAFAGRPLFAHSGWLHRWRSGSVLSGRAGDLGLIVAGLWLLAQLRPETRLFGAGDLRDLLALPTPVSFEAGAFIRLETMLVAASVLAVGLFVRCVLRAPRPWPIAVLLLLGVGAKSLASWSFFVPGEPLAWLTPGTSTGLLVGVPLLGMALFLPRVHQHALAGMAILVATTLANLIPENPYQFVDRRLLVSGNFLNFHGLTQVVASAWPFMALAYLSALGLWRGEHLRTE